MTAGQAEFAAVVTELTGLGAGLAAIYFTVSLVMTIAQSHAAAIAGQTQLLADLKERLIPIVLCVAVAATAHQLGDEVRTLLASGAADASAALSLWHALAGLVINTILFSTGATLAVGFATGAFAAQLAAFVGRPDVLSTAWLRLVMVILTAVLTLISLNLAQAVLQSIA